MTYPPPPGPDGSQAPPPDPSIQAYQPPQPYAPQPDAAQPYAPPTHPANPYSQPAHPANPYAASPQLPYPAQDPYAPANVDQYGYPAPRPHYDPGYAANPYAYQQHPTGPRPTEGLAIASLVVSAVSIAGLCIFSVGGLLGVLGAILGHVARKRIARTGDGGNGLALAGIIVGWVVAGLTVLALAGMVALFATSPSNGF